LQLLQVFIDRDVNDTKTLANLVFTVFLALHRLKNVTEVGQVSLGRSGGYVAQYGGMNDCHHPIERGCVMGNANDTITQQSVLDSIVVTERKKRELLLLFLSSLCYRFRSPQQFWVVACMSRRKQQSASNPSLQKKSTYK
jgi:hypothetical protein